MTIKQPFEGRMNRKNFILSQLVLLFLTLLLVAFLFRNGLQSISLESIDTLILLMFVGLPFQFVCVFRRTHDINQSGLWSFLIFVPYIALPFLVYISYKKGDSTTNRFGEPDTRKLFDSLINR